jgi:hypothetical protein
MNVMLSTERLIEVLVNMIRNLLVTVKFQVLNAVNLKVAALWVVAPCCLVGVYCNFRGTDCLHHQGDNEAPKMETVSTSETSVNFYQTTKCDNPEGSNPFGFLFLTSSTCGTPNLIQT